MLGHQFCCHFFRIETNSLNQRCFITQARYQRSLAIQPPPHSNILPFSLQVSWQRQPNSGMVGLIGTFLRSWSLCNCSSLVSAIGATELVKMFRLAPSKAKLCVNPCKANLAAEQLAIVAPPNSPIAEDRLTILPQPCSLIIFHTALVHLQAPSTCTLKVQLQSASDILLKPLALSIPALLTKISMRPNSFIALSIIFSPSSTELQSATAYPPACLIYQTTVSARADDEPPPITAPPKSLTTTFAPLEAKNNASSLPSPLPAPVITATLPSYLKDIFTPTILYLLEQTHLKMQLRWLL